MTKVSRPIWSRNHLKPTERFQSPLFLDIPKCGLVGNPVKIQTKPDKKSRDAIRIVVNQRRETVNSLWDACTCLIGYFSVYLDVLIGHKHSEVVRIVELGSGVGALGLSIAGMLQERIDINSNDTSFVRYEVISTELDDEMDILEENFSMNEELFGASKEQISLETFALDWSSSSHAKNLTERGPIDLVVASDIVYEIQYFADLIATLCRICDQNTLFVMAMEHRWRDIEGFWWQDLEAAGFERHVVRKTGKYWWEAIAEIDIYMIRKKVD